MTEVKEEKFDISEWWKPEFLQEFQKKPIKEKIKDLSFTHFCITLLADDFSKHIWFKYKKKIVKFDREEFMRIFENRESNESFIKDLFEVLKRHFPEEAFTEEGMKDTESNFMREEYYKDEADRLRNEIVKLIYENKAELIPDWVPNSDSYENLRYLENFIKEVKLDPFISLDEETLELKYGVYALNYFLNLVGKEIESKQHAEKFEKLKAKLLELNPFPADFKTIRTKLEIKAGSEDANLLSEVLGYPPFSYEKCGNRYVYMTMEQKEHLDVVKSENDKGVERV